MNLTKTGKTKITIKNFDPGRVYDTLRKRVKRPLIIGYGLSFAVTRDERSYMDGVYDTLAEVTKQA